MTPELQQILDQLEEEAQQLLGVKTKAEEIKAAMITELQANPPPPQLFPAIQGMIAYQVELASGADMRSQQVKGMIGQITQMLQQ